MIDSEMMDRAEGCLFGQLAGDALGSQVEFLEPSAIAKQFPGGVRDLRNGGTWNTIAGQPTDDSEMALILARLLIREGKFEAHAAFNEYLRWQNSNPFDIGATISRALQGNPSELSQANGAMMRVSPLGIFGVGKALTDVATMARSDAALTHPHQTCQDANALFTMAISTSIQASIKPEALYAKIAGWANEMKVCDQLQACILNSYRQPPDDYLSQAGWVLVAFGNALYRLLNSATLEEALVETVMAGGDTDTNAAIAGALLGSVHGRRAIPARWIQALLGCRPKLGDPRVIHPRPDIFWPVEAAELARSLLMAGLGGGSLPG